MRQLRQDPDSIVIDCYEGQYGLTVRFDIQERHTLQRLRSMFHDLARGHVACINMIEVPFVEASPELQELVLRHEGQPKENRKKLETIQESGRIWIRWSQCAEGWDECAELVDGLLEASPAGGHQYLTQDTIDDALVEIAFME